MIVCITYDVVKEMRSECICLWAWFKERRLLSSCWTILGLSFCDEINNSISDPLSSSICSKVTI